MIGTIDFDIDGEKYQLLPHTGFEALNLDRKVTALFSKVFNTGAKTDGEFYSAITESLASYSDNDINGGDDAYHMMAGIPELEKKYELEKNAPNVKEVDRRRRVRFRAILSPKFCPNARVELDSTTGDGYDGVLAVQGLFSIDKVEFNGGTAGSDFTVECEAVETT